MDTDNDTNTECECVICLEKVDKNKKVIAVVELDSYKYHHARQRDHKKTVQRNAYYLKNKHALMVIYADNVLRHGAKKVAKWVVTALGKS